MTSDERTEYLEKIPYSDITNKEQKELEKRRLYNTLAERSKWLPDHFTESDENMKKAIFMALMEIEDTLQCVAREISRIN